VRLRRVHSVGTPLLAGQLLRDRALGTESTYRVLQATESIVELEVIAAPGLKAGTRIEVCVTSALAMEPVAAPADARRAA
jgi:hypothetical protein